MTNEQTFEELMSKPATLCLCVMREGTTHLSNVEYWKGNSFSIATPSASISRFAHKNGKSAYEGIIHYEDIIVDAREITKQENIYLIKGSAQHHELALGSGYEILEGEYFLKVEQTREKNGPQQSNLTLILLADGGPVLSQPSYNDRLNS